MTVTKPLCARTRDQHHPEALAEQIEDEREIRDPKIRAIIRAGHQEFLAGKTRPIEEFLAERATRTKKRSRRRSGA